jgi:hypothetical protein
MKSSNNLFLFFDKTLLLMEGSIGRMARYVNHEYDTPNQAVGRGADDRGITESPIPCKYNLPESFWFETCPWALPPW